MDGANLRAHRAVAIALGSLLLIVAIVLIEARDAGGGGRWNISPLPSATTSRVERRLTELQARIAAATVRMSGEMSEARGTTVMAGAMPPRMLTLTDRTDLPQLAVVMLFGAAVASRAWGLGWARTAIVALI